MSVFTSIINVIFSFVWIAKSPTLIDQIPQAEWDDWNAANENPKVADSEGC